MVVGLYSQDAALQSLLSSAMGKEFDFFFVSSEDGIRRLIDEENCRVIILDLTANRHGLDDRIQTATELIRERITVLILADDQSRATAADLVREGAYGYLRRPPSLRELRVMLRRAEENAEVVAAPTPAAAADDTAPRMVGASDAMRQVHQLIDCVARIDASVLVEGESGTGKELVARAIHDRGNRARKPFVAVACGAIPETLIEAELFGHEKGAFTGTVGSREGYFEQAADGTLFLDEIGELTPYTQVKLLRVLQQREFSRLGSNKLIPLRARLVFATHRNLAEMVAEGKFRQDLYYRINVMKIDTPALAERPEDVPQIALHFLRRYAQQFRRPVNAIEPAALDILQNYSWPGNVRELENVIQQALIMSSGNTLRAADMPAHLRQTSAALDDEITISGSFERQLRDYKIRLAESALRDSNGNKTVAAKSLNISRAYLHRLIRLAEPGSFVDSAMSAEAVSQYN